MKRFIYVLMGCSLLLPGLCRAEPPVLKAVMQINNISGDVILRGLKSALEIADAAKSKNQKLDLHLVVFGPAVDLFEKGANPELTRYFKKLSQIEGVQLYADTHRLKRIHKEVKSLVPGFRDVETGAYEILRLQSEGYFYIKP